MPHSKRPSLIRNNRGLGLLTAIFAMVILSIFGLLLTRYITTSQISSAEDYIWGQTLYAAESTAQLIILYEDGGGSGAFTPPIVNDITTTNLTAPPIDLGGGAKVIRVEATRAGTGISRTIEVKFAL